jgi:hypothetical protein
MIELLVFTLLGVIIVVYGIVTLNLLSTKAAGILTLIVDISFHLLLYYPLLTNHSLTSQVYLRGA